MNNTRHKLCDKFRNTCRKYKGLLRSISLALFNSMYEIRPYQLQEKNGIKIPGRCRLPKQYHREYFFIALLREGSKKKLPVLVSA
jgi:hypothetical protein